MKNISSGRMAAFLPALVLGFGTLLVPALASAEVQPGLSEQLRREFPSLKESLAPQRAGYEETHRAVAGREISGWLTSSRADSGTDGGTTGLASKPEEEAAVRALAARQGAGGEFKAFFPERFTDSFAVEGGGVSAVLRPLGARSAVAEQEDGHVVYRDAYRATDSLHVIGAQRSEEFLYLRNAEAPRRFEYELTEVKGAAEVRLEENGAIQFSGENGRGLQIEAPWVVDATGKRLADAVKWELGETGPNGSRRLALVLSAGAKLSYPAVIDPSWSATGSLAGDRYSHTATLLLTGKVLVTGGYVGFGGTSVRARTCELYDPATGAWSATGNLTAFRADHTATLLLNGKVLVVGNGIAELYDPAAGTWSATGSPTNVRSLHTATLLVNGKVLLAGGNGTTTALTSAELYDPAAGTWSTTGTLTTGRSQHTATLLPNGKVLVAGGLNNGPVKTAELYDPAAGTWTVTAPLAAARGGHTATLLPSGMVLVAGGGYSTPLNSAELYDPASGTWSATGALAAPRQIHTATLLPNGKVLVAGGSTGNALANPAELYDPVAGTWTTTAALTTPRSFHTATLLPSGKVLVAAGLAGNNNSTKSAELYDWPAGTWTTTGALPSARSGHTATLLANGQVLVAGGFNSSALAAANLYDPAAGTWSATGSLIMARSNHTATLLPNGKVLVAGGNNGTDVGITELYDPAVGTWSTTGSLATARSNHTATLLSNGKVLVTGGTKDGAYLNSAELFDPAAGIWTTTGSLATMRKSHSATLLPNGKVLVAGGFNDNAVSSAELYDTTAGTWSATGALAIGRYSHSATLLPSGKVLVAGGNGALSGTGANPLNSAQLYDSASGTWSTTGSLETGRVSHSATVLPNGKVLVAGGFIITNVVNKLSVKAIASAELFDPELGTWSATAALGVARYIHTATLLPNGKVLVAGGTSDSAVASAELYDIGLNFLPAWQPQITSVSSFLTPGGKLSVIGSRFKGISQASSGNTADSSTNYPIVQLRRLDSEQVINLPIDPSKGWSDSSVTCTSVPAFPFGPAQVTVFTNGIPSAASYLVVVATAAPALTTQASTPTAAGAIHDTATLSGALNPTGTITFNLYGPNDATCSGTSVSTSTKSVSGNGDYVSADYTPSALGTYRWTARYSGDVNNAAINGQCNDPNESVVISLPAQLLNLSTRKQVGTGDNVTISGFIVVGTESKKIILRGIGPSLPIAGALADPTLELHKGNGILAFNNDWQDTQRDDIIATGIPPSDNLESAIVATLAAAPAAQGGQAYSGVLAGQGGGTGIGLLELYDLSVGSKSVLANISTRGFVDTGDGVLIGGFIPGPSDRSTVKVLIRGLGPSLPVSGALQDPLLELHDGNGNTLVTNDNWEQASNASDIQASGIAPSDSHEAAILISIPASNAGYTVVLRGVDSATGIGLVELYAIQ